MIELKRPQDLIISVRMNERVAAYMKRIQAGEHLDPVVVRGKRVIDGNHRSAAYKKLGMDIPTIPAPPS